MIRKIFISCAAGLFLLVSACATTTPEDTVAKFESAFTLALNTVKEFRAPCVDEDVTNDDMCKVDDDLYKQITVFVKAADFALDEAHLALDAEDYDKVDYWLQRFADNYDRIQEIIRTLEEEVTPKEEGVT